MLDEFQDIYVNSVIPHEFAHIVLNQCFPKEIQERNGMQEHGQEFKIVCAQLGYPHVGNESTNLFSKSQFMNAKNIGGVPYFDYSCGCKNHKVGSANHVKMQKGGDCKCKLCNSPLKRI